MNDAQMLILCLSFLACMGLGWLFGYVSTIDKYIDWDFWGYAVPFIIFCSFAIKAIISLVSLILKNWN